MLGIYYGKREDILNINSYFFTDFKSRSGGKKVTVPTLPNLVLDKTFDCCLLVLAEAVACEDWFIEVVDDLMCTVLLLFIFLHLADFTSS